jgi:hypothetical protein
MEKQPDERDITHLVEGKVIYLLVFVVAVQTLYPITAHGGLIATIGYQVIYAGLLVTGALLARDTPFHARALIVLGVVWLVAVLVFDFRQTAVWAQLVAYGALFLFQGMVIQVMLRFIFAARRVTRDVLYAAVAVYFLLGALFVPIYGVLESATLAQTGEHAFVDSQADAEMPLPWQNLVYYSYVTLTTAGYGDVLPVTLWARSLASLEAIIGVLYLTIIMARLVGLYAAEA